MCSMRLAFGSDGVRRLSFLAAETRAVVVEVASACRAAAWRWNGCSRSASRRAQA